MTITEKYEMLRGARGFLGQPLGPETAAPDGVGRYRHYQGGSIYWHPTTGAFEVHGDIRRKWSDLGWERSVLGYPVTDESATPAPNPEGRYNHFQNGSIYWHPNLGSFEVHGPIRDKWASLGWERCSFLGFPVTDETPTPSPNTEGRYNHFQHGSIYWHPRTGAFEVHGAIRDKWASLGWELSVLGFPVTDECATPAPNPQARYSHFEHGSIYCSPGTGCHEVHGPIRDLWAANGWEQGRFGFPTTDETQVVSGDRGRSSRFQNGTICWTPEFAAFADFAGGDPDGRFEGVIELFDQPNFAGRCSSHPVNTERPWLAYNAFYSRVSSLRMSGLPTHCAFYFFEGPQNTGRWTRIAGNNRGIVGIQTLPYRISGGFVVNHGLTSVRLTAEQLTEQASTAIALPAIDRVAWDGGPRLSVTCDRKLRVRQNAVIDVPGPDPDLCIGLYFRLFVTGPATLSATMDSWRARWEGSLAPNSEIEQRLHRVLDDPANQATWVNALNGAIDRSLVPLRSDAARALGLNLRRVNFLPEGLELVISDNDLGALVRAAGVPGVFNSHVAGQRTTGTLSP